MTQTRPVSDPAAMADILASIRRIVTEDDRKYAQSPLRPGTPGEVLILTSAMRIDAPKATSGVGRSDAARAPDLSLDDAPAALAGAQSVAAQFGQGPHARRLFADQTSASKDSGASAEAGSREADSALLAVPPVTVEIGAGDLSADEAVMVDIARAVFQEEFDRIGAASLTPLIRAIVREEVARAVDSQS